MERTSDQRTAYANSEQPIIHHTNQDVSRIFQQNITNPGTTLQSDQTQTPDSQKVNEHQTDNTKRFTLKPKLLEVIRTLPLIDKNKTIFTYKEILNHLSEYILTNRERFLDKGNVYVAIIKGDPLQAVFGVTAFHRCQVRSLLRNQIIPHEDPEPRAEWMEPGTSMEQNREEVRYDDEYEPESGEDDPIRPPQAMGEGPKPCSDTESEWSCPDHIEITEVNRIDYSSDYQADNERDPTSMKTIIEPLKRWWWLKFISMFVNKKVTNKCFDCKIKEVEIKYCKDCWNKRYKWIPKHRSWKRKGTSVDKQRNKYIKTDSQESISINSTELCIFCASRKIDTCLVHGEEGHRVSCRPCGKRLWKQKGRCPICRRAIEKIIRVM